MIVVGEALVDLVEEPDGRLAPTLGGAARNLAVAAARLGAEVQFVGGLSTDAFGRRLRADLDGEGVDTSCAPVVDDPTTLAVVTVGDGGQPAYAFHLAGTAALALHGEHLTCLASDAPLHVSLGALTLGTPGVGDAVVATLASHTALRSLDPNVRPAFLDDPARARARLEGALSVTDLVRCSDEDLTLLAPDEDPLAVARRWQHDVPVVVVTHGGDGAVAITPHGEVTVPAGTPSRVVDTVGAGDTFGAALLVALGERAVTDRGALAALGTDTWRDVLTFAGAAAAITVARRGADPPRRAELPD